MSNKPSERFCKHGFLLNERYNQDIHMYGRTIEERCQDFYTPDEIARMKSEVKVAECGICLEKLTDTNNCMCCSDGHKFHNTCLNEYWTTNPAKTQFCPTTNTIPTHGWAKKCSHINDIHSGGKKSRKSKKYSYIYMPNSKKRFSKKLRVVKKIKKNTRKHKKRTPRRKYKKSSRRLRFFGGDGEDEDCAICTEPLKNGATFTTNCNHIFHRACIERWCDGKRVCTCPSCRTVLDPNPNPNPSQEELGPRIYRVQFFTFANNPQTGEIDRVPVSISNIPDQEMNIIEDYFLEQYPGLIVDNILFYGDELGNNPNAYIYLFGYQNNVVIDEGDIEITPRDPETGDPINVSVQSATISQTDGGFN